MNGKKLKLIAATAGVGGVLTMGALTTLSGTSVAESPPPGPVAPAEMSLPETSTETTAPPTPATPVAEPEIKGPAPTH